MNQLEHDLYSALENLNESDMVALANQSRMPEVRGPSLPLGSWLYLALESEFERRHGREYFHDKLDLHAMTDRDVAGAFQVALALFDAQISSTAADFATRLLRLIGAHACARLHTREIALCN